MKKLFLLIILITVCLLIFPNQSFTQPPVNRLDFLGQLPAPNLNIFRMFFAQGVDCNDPSSANAVYFNTTTNGFEMCQSGGAAPVTVFVQAGDEIYLADNTNPENLQVGIGVYPTPTSPMDLKLNIHGGILATGDFNVSSPSNNLATQGVGTRLIWHPKKAAFRAGRINNNTDYWNGENIGNNSVAFGMDNGAWGTSTTVSGGTNNASFGPWSTIGGGKNNIAGWGVMFGSGAAYESATVAGGAGNRVEAPHGFIGGGRDNEIYSRDSAICGGFGNHVPWGASHGSFVGGGQDNIAGGDIGLTGLIFGSHSTVTGGFANVAFGDYATVGGGANNRAAAVHSTVSGGGVNNWAYGDGSVISGGRTNKAYATNASIGGGHENSINYDWVAETFLNPGAGGTATIAGGNRNRANGADSTIGGGIQNIANGPASTIAGGNQNQAEGQDATVGGGHFNEAQGNWSTVSGGSGNIASGIHSVVPGGEDNIAGGRYSWAGGANMQIANTANKTFVWGHSDDGAFAVDTPNVFLIDPVNKSGSIMNVGIGTPAPEERLHVVGTVKIDDTIQLEALPNQPFGCSAGHAGTLFHKQGVPSALCFCDGGGAWEKIGGGGGCN